jgi:two-component system LytT family response regulator
MILRTVIADDEQEARELLKLYLAQQEGIHVVGECQNGRETIAYLKSEAVDLLLLDIEMPGLGGFDVVEQVGLRNLPPTIFVTAYNEYAVRAFEVQAVDYLTKPVEPKRLVQAIDRVREKITAKSALLARSQLDAVLTALQANEVTKPYPTRLLVKDGDKEILLPVESIEWIEAAEYYCCLHANKRRYLLRETITDLSNKLDSGRFVRIHRSAIVNLNFIREIYRDGQGDGSIILSNGEQIRMSRSGKQRLLEIGKL